MSFADKTLVCRDCGMEFIFTSGEQEFYAQKGFDNEPTRCSSCRQSRKQGRSSSTGGGGYDRSSSRDSGGGYRREPSEMHTATCASCGGEAQVPFVPRGDKPVYCSNCFQSQRPARSTSSRW